MANGKQTGRDVAVKIAVPAILVFSLFVARLMVQRRSAILLSAPVELKRCGLAVSMPSGNGWQSSEKWAYQDNKFIITSSLSIDRASRSYAQCQYILAGEPTMPAQRFDEQAAELEGQVVETGQLRTNAVLVDWARIAETAHGEAGGSDVIFGICQLPAGRQLEIEVLTQDEKGQAWDVFGRIVKAVRFQDDGLLQAGAEIIGEAKNAGLTETLAQDSDAGHLSSLLLILNPGGRPIGFTLDVIIAQRQDAPAVKAANYYYQQGLLPQEAIGSFRSDDAFENFSWNVESTGRAGSQHIEMTGNNESLTVQFAAERQFAERENQYLLGKAAVPDAISESILKKFRQSPSQEIIIDLIRPDGTVTPVYIEKISPLVKGESYLWAIHLELLDGWGFGRQVYYDDDGPPAKIVAGEPGGTYTFLQANPEQVAGAFPERADLILNHDRLFER